MRCNAEDVSVKVEICSPSYPKPVSRCKKLLMSYTYALNSSKMSAIGRVSQYGIVAKGGCKDSTAMVDGYRSTGVYRPNDIFHIKCRLRLRPVRHGDI
jgi:hypothetical protein